MKKIARRLSQTLADQDSDFRRSEVNWGTAASVTGTGQRKAARMDKSIKMNQLRRRGQQEACCRHWSRAIVENKVFVGFTTLLTVYALVGDDIRLLCTNKPADLYFDILTILCIAIFSLEIILSCIGKSDYFLSFFFLLDIIATSTMILDISWVAEFVNGDGEENLNNLRSGRTARVGARASRVVRVIRLVRILKLYKAIHEAREQKKKQLSQEEDWGDDDQDDERKSKTVKSANLARESKVGKKLSEMTTRRCIVLVLSMLLVRPFLQVESSELPPNGSYFGAEEVLEYFSSYNSSKSSTMKLRYERSFLKFMYFFNWFSGNYPDKYSSPEGTSELGPSSYQSHVFWVGVMTLDPAQKSYVENDSAWASLQIDSSTVTDFAINVPTNHIYDYGRMPTVAQDKLGTQWMVSCGVSDKGITRRGFSLLEDDIDGEVGYEVKCPEDLRALEKAKYFPRTTTLDQYKKWHFAFYFDNRPMQHQEARYSLMTTGFVCVILCAASLSFSNDANRLVLRPLEKMMNRVDIIRNDPLVAVQMADEEFKHEEKEKAKLRTQRSRRINNALQNHLAKLKGCYQSQEEGAVMETVILEKTIIKLGSLLALGFGEAGANIIHHNMAASESAGVNGMVPGERVEAIIGVARIRDFSVATEVLKAKVMTFVNQIAEIVHGVVSEFHGAANKNNGETFMLIWRISGLEDAMASRMADFSTIAFAKILGAIYRSPCLASYRGHPALQQRLGSTYRVGLSIGLHAGWAIEGAVGSEFKIDASYLSPNVSIAGSVEQATAIYRVPFLVTCSVMDLCCPEISAKFRRIDRVRIKGSTTAIDILCLDLECMNLSIDHHKEGRPHVWNSRLRFKARQFLEAEKIAKLDFKQATVEMFDGCQDIAKMRRRFSIEFMHTFEMGFANYFEGEWQAARTYLLRAQQMLRVEDGPSVALLRFMEHHYFQAPSWWTGVHDLLEANNPKVLPMPP